MIVTDQENIIEQLVDIYLTKEFWHNNHLPREIAIRYFSKLYNNGNIIVELDQEKVIGYIEVWALDYKQTEKILDGSSFFPEDEPISEGYYCYIANIYIDKDYRRRNLVSKLKRRAENLNPQCQAVILNSRKYNGKFHFYNRRR